MIFVIEVATFVIRTVIFVIVAVMCRLVSFDFLRDRTQQRVTITL